MRILNHVGVIAAALFLITTAPASAGLERASWYGPGFEHHRMADGARFSAADPTIVGVSVAGLQSRRESLLDEAFGPLSIVVEYPEGAELAAIADGLFEGNLTGTVHAAAGEDDPVIRRLVGWITRHAGRVLFGGWPTGVAVTPAMQHGGPWPATTNDSSTSVGTAAIARFLRPVAYQDAPQELLPEPPRDDNPWGVPQARAAAGESRSWGSRVLG